MRWLRRAGSAEWTRRQLVLACGLAATITVAIAATVAAVVSAATAILPTAVAPFTVWTSTATVAAFGRFFRTDAEKA